MENTIPYQTHPNVNGATQKPRQGQIGGSKAGCFGVLLSTVGNPDFSQNPHTHLPGMNPYYLRVMSLLEAREKCLEFIETTGIGGGNWGGGAIRKESGKVVARVSYNGRLWQPGRNQTLTPFPPLVEYDQKSCMLQLGYGATYQKMRVRLSELANQAFRIADPLEAGKFMII